jgi:hypothetical protein
MPAFAPVEKSLLNVFERSDVFEGVLVDIRLEVVEAEDAFVCEAEVDCVEAVEEHDNKFDGVVTKPTNTGATVTLLLGSLQQSDVSPQHQVVELAVPSQGVTRTSFFWSSPYT